MLLPNDIAPSQNKLNPIHVRISATRFFEVERYIFDLTKPHYDAGFAAGFDFLGGGFPPEIIT